MAGGGGRSTEMVERIEAAQTMGAIRFVVASAFTAR
jgi:hypothetical protein